MQTEWNADNANCGPCKYWLMSFLFLSVENHKPRREKNKRATNICICWVSHMPFFYILSVYWQKCSLRSVFFPLFLQPISVIAWFYLRQRHFIACTLFFVLLLWFHSSFRFCFVLFIRKIVFIFAPIFNGFGQKREQKCFYFWFFFLVLSTFTIRTLIFYVPV